MLKKVVFLGMGGTIAGTATSAHDNVGYTAAQVQVRQLLGSLPALERALAGYAAASEQVCQIDSKDLAHADWLALARRVVHHLRHEDVAGVVITHGTDTLEETAYGLLRLVPAELRARKPVVVTCAMRPASSLTPDGPGNLTDATTVATWGGARGVLVVCAGKIHSALTVQKIHPYQTDAFDSSEAGPLGRIEEGRVRLLQAWPEPATGQSPAHLPADLDSLDPATLPRVEVLLSYAGATGATVRSLLQVGHGDQPIAGLVIAGTGNGTIHKDMLPALEQAQRSGVRVVRASRCAYGQVVTASNGLQPGEWVAYPLSAVKARIALMLDIASGS